MAAFEIPHNDPAPLSRAASVRSARERDAGARARAREQTPAERLWEGLRLARFAAAIRSGTR